MACKIMQCAGGFVGLAGFLSGLTASPVALCLDVEGR